MNRPITILCAAILLAACGDSSPSTEADATDTTSDVREDVIDTSETAPDVAPDIVELPETTPDAEDAEDADEEVTEPVLTEPPAEVVEQCKSWIETGEPECYLARYEFECEDSEVTSWKRCTEGAPLCVTPIGTSDGGCSTATVDTECPSSGEYRGLCVGRTGNRDFAAICDDGEIISVGLCASERAYCSQGGVISCQSTPAE